MTHRWKLEPTVFGMKAAGNRADMACWARQPVQCAGTRTPGFIAARASSTRRTSGPNDREAGLHRGRAAMRAGNQRYEERAVEVNPAKRRIERLPAGQPPGVSGDVH